MPHLARSVTIQPILLLLFSFLLVPAAQAQEDLPPELQPWVSWVLAGHPELSCPVTPRGAACIWPGALVLDLDERGGRFTLAVRTDREIAVPLPGGQARWPQQVRVDGERAPVLDQAGLPMVVLPPRRSPGRGSVPMGQPAPGPAPAHHHRCRLPARERRRGDPARHR